MFFQKATTMDFIYLRTDAVEPITGGNITGPCFTGTIASGSAVVTVTGNGTVANPFVQIFGEADDGSPFIAAGQGVGKVVAQVSRLVS